ncbi:MAG: MOSC domain-containing protein [Maribacter sp.]
MTEIGTIESIFRYPIKSLGGEKLLDALIDQNGVEGDRYFAFKDCESGFIVSCKHPTKWGGIIELSATINKGNSIVVKDSDEKIITGKEEIESKIRELTSRKVELISVKDNLGRQYREADRSNIDEVGATIKQEPLSIVGNETHFFDFAPLHLITSSSLDYINMFYSKGDFNVQRFRPNLFIKTANSNKFEENEWIGKKIRIGHNLEIKIVEPTPRCVLTTLKQGELEKDRKILKTIAQNSSAKRFTFFPGETLKGTLGVYSIVLKKGSVKVGDKVQLIDK